MNFFDSILASGGRYLIAVSMFCLVGCGENLRTGETFKKGNTHQSTNDDLLKEADELIAKNEQDSTNKAIELLKDGVEKRDYRAALRLAIVYGTGRGVTLNTDKTINYFSEAKRLAAEAQSFVPPEVAKEKNLIEVKSEAERLRKNYSNKLDASSVDEKPNSNVFNAIEGEAINAAYYIIIDYLGLEGLYDLYEPWEEPYIEASPRTVSVDNKLRNDLYPPMNNSPEAFGSDLFWNHNHEFMPVDIRSHEGSVEVPSKRGSRSQRGIINWAKHFGGEKLKPIIKKNASAASKGDASADLRSLVFGLLSPEYREESLKRLYEIAEKPDYNGIRARYAVAKQLEERDPEAAKGQYIRFLQEYKQIQDKLSSSQQRSLTFARGEAHKAVVNFFQKTDESKAWEHLVAAAELYPKADTYRYWQAWIIDRALRGDVDAMKLLAADHLDNERYEYAATVFRDMALYGDRDAALSLGKMHDNGIGTLKDSGKAFTYYSVAAVWGNTEAIALRDKRSGIFSSFDRQKDIDAFLKAAAATNRGNAESRKANTPAINTGTAFYISDSLLLTSWHVVQGAKLIQVGSDGKNLAQVVAKDEALDVALLKASSPVKESLSLYDQLVLGADCWVIGYPNINIQGAAVKVTKGVISSKMGLNDASNEFQMSAAVQPGNSGSPILDNSGRVVGMVSRRLDSTTSTKQVQNVNYGISGSAIFDFLKRVGMAEKLGSTSTSLKDTEALLKSELKEVVPIKALVPGEN
jgi:S1-C subfamily serine protease